MYIKVASLDLQSVTVCCLNGPFCVCHGDNGRLTLSIVCTLVRVVMSVCMRVYMCVFGMCLCVCVCVCVCVGVCGRVHVHTCPHLSVISTVSA